MFPAGKKQACTIFSVSLSPLSSSAQLASSRMMLLLVDSLKGFRVGLECLSSDSHQNSSSTMIRSVTCANQSISKIAVSRTRQVGMRDAVGMLTCSESISEA